MLTGVLLFTQCTAQRQNNRQCGDWVLSEGTFCTLHQEMELETGSLGVDNAPVVARTPLRGSTSLPASHLASAHTSYNQTDDEQKAALTSTPISTANGSTSGQAADVRRFSRASDLVHRACVSKQLLDDFIQDAPVVTEQQVGLFRKSEEWNEFLRACTDGPNQKSSLVGSNEKQFRALVERVAKIEGLKEYFEEPALGREGFSPRQGHIRLSHQGAQPMKTWDRNAEWLKRHGGSTANWRELKPDFITMPISRVKEEKFRQARPVYVCPAASDTILPPPADWEPLKMPDDRFPTVECKDPVWESVDSLWELKQNRGSFKEAKVYVDCALKAAEALRYQWSRRYICCFLHCGSTMQLLHFDRSGLIASEKLDIRSATDKFVRCLLGAFCHEPSKLGYPVGPDSPCHGMDLNDGQLRQVVTVKGRSLYLGHQEAGPPADHLVSRATVAFRAKLVSPNLGEKTSWDWCYKSSWPQRARRHEGEYLKCVQGLPDVVELLVHGVVQIKGRDDTTMQGRNDRSLGEPMELLDHLYNRLEDHRGCSSTQRSGLGPDPFRHSSSESKAALQLNEPRRPQGSVARRCEDREHRELVVAWVDLPFHKAVRAADLPTALATWKQTFSAIGDVVSRGILHRDLSFQNIRFDEHHQVKVCDFDMAISVNEQASGVAERTGTIAFMAASVLNHQPSRHRPFYDCESVFWLCALSLLADIGSEMTQESVDLIKDPSNNIVGVRQAKFALVLPLAQFQKSEQSGLGLFVHLDTPKDTSLFFCLTELMRYFNARNYYSQYTKATEEEEKRCFSDCAGIVDRVIQEDCSGGVKDVTQGITDVSLSS